MRSFPENLLISLMFLMLIPLVSIAKADLNDGLVAYWSFDNCDARDDSGNGHDGTIYGSLECVIGISGKAFKFGGYEDMGYIDVFDRRFEEITVSVWLRYDLDYVPLNDLGYKVVSVVDGWKDSENFALLVKEEDNGSIVIGAAFHEYIANTNLVYPEIHVYSEPISPYMFYHAVMTYKNKTLKLYINGELVAETQTPDYTYSVNQLSPEPDIRIGIGLVEEIPTFLKELLMKLEYTNVL